MFKFKWLQEERAILQEAYHKGFSLKVIANGLARTESSINKQLKRDNIRQGDDRRRQVRNNVHTHNMSVGQDKDFSNLIRHTFSEEGLKELRLRKQAVKSQQAKTIGGYSFTYVEKALHQASTYPTHKRQRVKYQGDDRHTFKSLVYVESWAKHHGFEFRRIGEASGFPLYHTGGRVCSHTQFMMNVNQRRIDQGQPAFVVTEWGKWGNTLQKLCRDNPLTEPMISIEIE